MQLRRTQKYLAILLCAASLLAAVPGVVFAEAGPGAHDQVRCGDCHGGGAYRKAAVQAAGPVAAAVSRRCAGCHDGIAPIGDGGHAFHGQANRSCTECHSFHETDRLRAGDREFKVPLGDPGVQAHCQACHQPGTPLSLIDPGHRFAAESVYHDDSRDLARMSASDACLVCHDPAGAAVEMPRGAPAILQINTHASHPFGIRFSPGQGSGDRKIRHEIDPRLPLPNGKIECVTCHSIPGGAKDLMVPFEDPYAMCLGCHRVGDRRRSGGTLALADGR